MREGEIVQVQGGHIIRATGRKDRHSKVYTAKGPRDRRVRLSAHTAIQFYDVQDRLGCDRPSKAVDWLMKKAKTAIDKLAQLPPFDPVAGAGGGGGGNVGVVGPPDLGGGDEIGHQFQAAGNQMGFHGYPHQDLCLSLQSFQNPGLGSDPGHPNSNHALFPVGFGEGPSSGGGHWEAAQEQNLAEMGQFSRLMAWSGGGYGGGERGSLQSTFHPPAPSIRAWDDVPMGSTEGGDHHNIPKAEMQGGMQQSTSMAGIGVLGSDGFMGYCIPAAGAQMHGGGGGGGGGEDQDVHGITVAYHHNNSVSSMSTDSSR